MMRRLFGKSYDLGSSVPQPLHSLEFLLFLAFCLVGLELLLGEMFVAALCFEATAIVAIGSSVDIEEGIHLASALVLIVVELWTHARLLELASESIEVACC